MCGPSGSGKTRKTAETDTRRLWKHIRTVADKPSLRRESKEVRTGAAVPFSLTDAGSISCASCSSPWTTSTTFRNLFLRGSQDSGRVNDVFHASAVFHTLAVLVEQIEATSRVRGLTEDQAHIPVVVDAN